MAYTALVVEDSPSMRQLIVFALSRVQGLSVVEAENGIEALKRLGETAHLDLMFVDINMPILDGLKLIKRVREDAQHAKVPIVVITTEGAEADRQRAMALGASGYIAKPVQAKQVLEQARHFLNLE